ncbi:MAG: hypothetical protein CMO64_06445 [Verrucomicrobiales bacterium]|nr:hypothetical protein [Verrucomicrobiales bacterium]
MHHGLNFHHYTVALLIIFGLLTLGDRAAQGTGISFVKSLLNGLGNWRIAGKIEGHARPSNSLQHQPM